MLGLETCGLGKYQHKSKLTLHLFRRGGEERGERREGGGSVVYQKQGVKKKFSSLGNGCSDTDGGLCVHGAYHVKTLKKDHLWVPRGPYTQYIDWIYIRQPHAEHSIGLFM